MKSSEKKYPRWVWKALQGITYWIGHRQCMYNGHPLAEAALVAEICNLIYAHLPKEWKLTCEVQYSELLKGKKYPDSLPSLARADLVVSKKSTDNKKAPSTRFVIEVKRAAAPAAQINSDLVRLATVCHEHSGIRGFMFVVAERGRPKKFVLASGFAKKGQQKIKSCKGYYRVLKVWKAFHLVSNKDVGHYACLVEVFGM